MYWVRRLDTIQFKAFKAFQLRTFVQQRAPQFHIALYTNHHYKLIQLSADRKVENKSERMWIDVDV